MKKTRYLLSIIICFALVSCAPSKSESVVEDAIAEETLKQENGNTLQEDMPQEIVWEDTPEILPETESIVLYPAQVALDYVEKPQKRSREEAIEKIKDLSTQFPQLSFVVENEALYPNGLLTSVANNPEMADYVCGYPEADGNVTAGFTEAELEQEHPLFLQFDPRWGYCPYGVTVMGDSGCGPTCLSMAVFYLTGDANITPDVVGRYSMDNGYYVKGVGTAWALLVDYPAIHGLHSATLSVNEEAMNKKLEEGNILICSMRPGNFTAGGHFVVVYGVDEEGYKVNDPKCVYRSNQRWSYEELSADIKGIWCVGR